MRTKLNSFILTLFTLFFFTDAQAQANAATTVNGLIEGSITVDGIERTYLLYIPKNYSATVKMPLVLNYHGYTGSAKQQMVYGDFRAEAEANNFLVVQPQGTLLDGKTHWNVGGWTLNSSTDDVKFTTALIDELIEKYNLDAKRIYATGMSNGGYMSFKLACELGDKIAAIASVTGSMTPQTFTTCNPQRPIPILQIHGVSDPTVPYSGAIWSKSIADVLDYWVKHNETTTTPEKSAVPDTNKEDKSTAERWVYQNNSNQIPVIHYKISGGKHTWPGAAYNAPGTNQDFKASRVIWEFFSHYDLDGYIKN